MADEEVVVEAAGRQLSITHPEKVFFEERGETKLDLVRFYQAVADPLLAAMGDRPVLLQRFPHGASGSSFFQKRVPDARPEWLQTTVVSTPNGTTSRALVAADLAHVLWAVNLACLGFHVWPAKAADPEHADELRIDLDPSKGVTFPMLREAAAEVRSLLDELGVMGLPKTTGNRGIHVYVRLEPRWTSYQVRDAAVAVARELERRRPDLVTAAWWKEERGQRVFVDFNQNAPHKTIFGAWSVRARPGRPGVDAIRLGRAGRHRTRPADDRDGAGPGRGAGRPVGGDDGPPPDAGPVARPPRTGPGRRSGRRALAPRLPQDAGRTAPGGAQPGPQAARDGIATGAGAGPAGQSSAVGVHPLGRDQDGDPALGPHHFVVGVPVVVGSARGGEDVPEQHPQPFGIDARERVIRSGQLNRPLDRGPIPPGPDDHGGAGSGPEVGQLAAAARGHGTDTAHPGEGMVEHAAVDDRRLHGSVLANGRHDAQSVVERNETGEVVNVGHVGSRSTASRLGAITR